MIAIETREHCVFASVAGEFTLADFKSFEDNVLHELEFHGTANLLIDLSDMLSYTVDVVWEELQFGRAHAASFGKVAVVCQDTWVSWAVWVSQLFVQADVVLFDNSKEAESWLMT
ncbi:STAS/SEC14 domain-containing protein [Burkholderiaceae bacterium DAT-1]|nr:STAS/SEC14 domain-containing protein [Burkholderiaceae bacterium DAT-1]